MRFRRRTVRYPLCQNVFSLITPLSISCTVLHSTEMSSAECEHIRIVLPCSLYESRYSRISFTPSLSRPLNGSSRISIFGFSMIACARPSLCRIPRLYLRTCHFRSGSSPTCFYCFLFHLCRSCCSAPQEV